MTLRQLARAQPKGLNFPVFLREKCTCCELLSFSKLLEFNDWQNAVTSCPTVPNDLQERELFYCKHRCSRASTSSKLSEVLMSETRPHLGSRLPGTARFRKPASASQSLPNPDAVRLQPNSTPTPSNSRPATNRKGSTQRLPRRTRIRRRENESGLRNLSRRMPWSWKPLQPRPA